MKMFEFTWSDNSSAGHVFVLATTREDAVSRLNDQFRNQDMNFIHEQTYHPGEIAAVTTEQNPL